MTPPDEPSTNPYDPNWPPPEQPYGQPSGPPPNPAPYQPYAQQPPAQPYGQAPYGQAQYGAPSYGGPMLPAHPSATTAMILGVGSLVGALTCVFAFSLFLAPFAWVIGGRAVKEIDANPGRFSGRDQAQAGRIMGMVGTAILTLVVLGFISLLAIGIASSSDDYTYNDTYSDSDSF